MATRRVVADLEQPSHWMDGTFEDLKQSLMAMGQPTFRARQLFESFASHHNSEQPAITTWPKNLYQTYFSKYSWRWYTQASHFMDPEDQTQKWVIQLNDGLKTQMVMIPDQDRRTLCISSQVGCAMGCTFCSTGDMGFGRHLLAGEIVGQLLFVNEQLRNQGDQEISNIVFMGMGEPLHNEKQVRAALDWFTNPELLGMSPSRVTVSSVGLGAPMERLIRETKVNIALSLHSAISESRNTIVPAEKGYSFIELKKLLLTHRDDFGSQRKLTLEIVAIPEINIDQEHIQAIIDFAKDLTAMINLIPFNPYPGSRYQRPSGNALHEMQKTIKKAGLSCYIRRTRGQRILAACGTLNTAISNSNEHLTDIAA